MNKPFSITQGVWPVMPTPFKDNGELDLDKVPELVDFYLNAGCAGIFAVAGSGEMFFLTQEERLKVVEATMKAVNGRAQVLTGGNFGPDLETQIAEVNQFASLGVDAAILILSVVPLSSKPWNADELVGQLLRIADATTIPLGMYECPNPEHRTLSAEDIARLAPTGRFHFLKETTQDREYIQKKIDAGLNTPFKVFPASMAVFMQRRLAHVGGYNGIIANVVPEVLVRIDQLGENSLEYSNSIRERMFELEKGFLNNLYPASSKHLLRARGLTLNTRSRMGENPILTQEQLARVDLCKDLMADLLATAGAAVVQRAV